MHGSSLKYAWLSDGTKVLAKADDGSGNGVQKRYLGSFVLTSNTEHSADEATEVESIAWDEGRIFLDVPFAGLDGGDIVAEDTTAVVADSLAAWINYYCDCWFAGDHLGNVRSVIDITPDLIAPQVLEQSNYLPYGTRIRNPNFEATPMGNRWRYAGKEEQDFTSNGSLDLSLLDFGARMYDPFMARWTAVDPLANLSHPFGPFSYCAGNPIISRDKDGNFPETVWDVASLVMGVKSFVSNVKEGNVGGAILDGVGIVADAAAVAMPFVPGGVSAGIKVARSVDKVADLAKTADKTFDAARRVDNVTDISKDGAKIVISKANKVDRSLLNAPKKPGNAPTFKSDGTKVEIHHIGQDPQGPYKEMHWSDHRGKGHYKENHPQPNDSKIDRKSFNIQRKEYWENEFKTNH